jgi:Aflatoxin regulatory protein
MGKPPVSARKLKASFNASPETEQKVQSYRTKKRQNSSHTFIKKYQMQPILDPSQCLFNGQLMDTDNLVPINWQDNPFEASAFGNPATEDLQLSADNLLGLPFDLMGDSTAQLLNNTRYIFNEDSISSIDSSRSQSHEPILEVRSTPPAKNSSCSGKASLMSCTYDLDITPNSIPGLLTHTNTPIDRVPINNKTVIDNSVTLVSCPCSDSSRVALNLTFVCDKILGMYENVLNAAVTACISRASGCRRLGSCVDIPVGAYKMDAEGEERMRVHVVMNELRKAKVLVDEYANKYFDTEASAKAAEETYSTLGSFLTSGLTATFQELLRKLEG